MSDNRLTITPTYTPAWPLRMTTILVFVLAIALFLMPLSAQAASSSSVTRSILKEVEGQDFAGKNLIRAEFTNTTLKKANFSNADLRGGLFNGVVLDGANLHGIDFTLGIAYLSKFKDVDLTDALLVDATLLQSSFERVDVTGADFTNAVLDKTQVNKLCATASGVNSRTDVDTRESLGCD